MTTFAGSGSYDFLDGNGTNAAFRNPLGVALDASGTVYIADYFNQRIRKLSTSGSAPQILCFIVYFHLVFECHAWSCDDSSLVGALGRERSRERQRECEKERERERERTRKRKREVRQSVGSVQVSTVRDMFDMICDAWAVVSCFCGVVNWCYVEFGLCFCYEV